MEIRRLFLGVRSFALGLLLLLGFLWIFSALIRMCEGPVEPVSQKERWEQAYGSALASCREMSELDLAENGGSLKECARRWAPLMKDVGDSFPDSYFR
jgi:hypothetical protein